MLGAQCGGETLCPAKDVTAGTRATRRLWDVPSSGFLHEPVQGLPDQDTFGSANMLSYFVRFAWCGNAWGGGKPTYLIFLLLLNRNDGVPGMEIPGGFLSEPVDTPQKSIQGTLPEASSLSQTPSHMGSYMALARRSQEASPSNNRS